MNSINKTMGEVCVASINESLFHKGKIMKGTKGSVTFAAIIILFGILNIRVSDPSVETSDVSN